MDHRANKQAHATITFKCDSTTANIAVGPNDEPLQAIKHQ